MREKLKFINGRLMICPRCKKYHDILQYNRLMEIEEFAEHTSPPYKCPSCKWIFCPSDNLLEMFLLQRSTAAAEVE